ncbi:acetyl-CoA C-acetyltransferase, partial [Phenoliferia sp. Uapishka_3]
MASRLSQIASHLTSASLTPREKLLLQSPDDVVICASVRTPLTKARKGGLAKASVDLMLATVLREVVKRSGVEAALVEDIIVGSVLTPGGGGASLARMAALAAGIPATTSIATTNRQCASGLQAVATVAAAIRSGQIDIGIGSGVESMTLYHFDRYKYRVGTDGLNDIAGSTLAIQEAADCLLPMGLTSENVASLYSIPRSRQDAFSAQSTAKASSSQDAGFFVSEIVPVTLADGTVVSTDDGIRRGTTEAALGKLKPVFKPEGGSTTAGNASQLTDGAAAVLLARRSKAMELGLPILGKFCGFVSAGVPPKIMGVGPAYAIPKLFGKLGIDKKDVDFFEINEAFASQAIIFTNICFTGGATGARQIATAMAHAKRTGEKVFVTSMCVGSGMGCAACFVSEQ